MECAARAALRPNFSSERIDGDGAIERSIQDPSDVAVAASDIIELSSP